MTPEQAAKILSKYPYWGIAKSKGLKHPWAVMAYPRPAKHSSYGSGRTLAAAMKRLLKELKK